MTEKPEIIAVGKGCKAPRPITRAQEMAAYYKNTEIDILAKTLWGEARGEGSTGMQAVACVILNRVKKAAKKSSYWWGNNIIQVCQKPYQFSCWNRRDANYQKMQALDESDLYFATARRIAKRAVEGKLEDSTNGADHYHAENVQPFWAKGREPITKIGHHIFYKLE